MLQKAFFSVMMVDIWNMANRPTTNIINARISIWYNQEVKLKLV